MTNRPPFDRSAKVALITVVVLLVGSSVGFESAVRMLNVVLQKEPVELADHFDNIPMRVGDWHAEGEAAKLSAEMVEELGTDLYLDRRYELTGDARGRWVSLHVAYYTGMIDAVPHVPDRCLVAGGFNARSRPQNLELPLPKLGWYEDPEDERYEMVTFTDTVTRAPVSVRMPRGDFRLRTTEFSWDKTPESRIYAGYFFIANGRVAVTPEEVKLVAFRKSESHAYYCKVQLMSVGDSSYSAEDFVEQAAEFLDDLLPELMRCLPDWKLIEQGVAGDGVVAATIFPDDSEIPHGSAS